MFEMKLNDILYFYVRVCVCVCAVTVFCGELQSAICAFILYVLIYHRCEKYIAYWMDFWKPRAWIDLGVVLNKSQWEKGFVAFVCSFIQQQLSQWP